jgi:hypothetical protein
MTDRRKTVTHATITREGKRALDSGPGATTRLPDDALRPAVELGIRTSARYEDDEEFEAYPTVH